MNASNTRKNRSFRFMTGAHSYRIQAVSRAEALAYAVHALNADAALTAVIDSTLYEEGAETVFAADASETSSKTEADDQKRGRVLAFRSSSSPANPEAAV